MLRIALKSAFVLALIAGAVALIRDTRYQGQDFEVFWRITRHVFAGEQVYDTTRDGAMVFKYPPWILPALFPFGLVPLDLAKWLWGILEVVSLAWVCIWLRHYGCQRLILFVVLFAFWGIWAVHALDGQVELGMLALALAAWPVARARNLALAGWALSTKIFTSVSMIGAIVGRPRSSRWLHALVVTVGLCLVLSLPALWATPSRSPIALLKSWRDAATSGGATFGGGKVRGRDNQGLPALILRVANTPSERAEWDVAVAGIVAIFLAWLWSRVSGRLTPEERWTGWLAMGAVVHPLAWFHLFVLAFPLAAFALDRGWRSSDVRTGLLAALGVFAIGGVTAKTLGELGFQLELMSIKSWGVLACAAALVRARGASHA